MRECISLLAGDSPHKKKILLGLNFYGRDFAEEAVEPIVGSTYLEVLFPHFLIFFNL